MEESLTILENIEKYDLRKYLLFKKNWMPINCEICGKTIRFERNLKTHKDSIKCKRVLDKKNKEKNLRVESEKEVLRLKSEKEVLRLEKTRLKVEVEKAEMRVEKAELTIEYLKERIEKSDKTFEEQAKRLKLYENTLSKISLINNRSRNQSTVNQETAENIEMDGDVEIEKLIARVKYLENRYVRSCAREDFPPNVVYLITNPDLKKRSTYIVGRSVNLKNRVGTYNKTVDHEVVFTFSCKTPDEMNMLETHVLSKLNKFRETANRDRFILPDGETTKFFSDKIEETAEFFEILPNL